MPQRESLYHKHPDYRVDLERSSRRVRVRLGGEVVADSQRTLVVRETNHEPVIYFPREDVCFELLESTAHRTFCPFKGEASFWTLRAGGRVEENAVWGYEDPFEQVSELRDYLAFYANRVEWQHPS